MDTRTWTLLLNTAMLTAAVAAISVPAGSLLAWLLAHGRAGPKDRRRPLGRHALRPAVPSGRRVAGRLRTARMVHAGLRRAGLARRLSGRRLDPRHGGNPLGGADRRRRPAAGRAGTGGTSGPGRLGLAGVRPRDPAGDVGGPRRGRALGRHPHGRRDDRDRSLLGANLRRRTLHANGHRRRAGRSLARRVARRRAHRSAGRGGLGAVGPIGAARPTTDHRPPVRLPARAVARADRAVGRGGAVDPRRRAAGQSDLQGRRVGRADGDGPDPRVLDREVPRDHRRKPGTLSSRVRLVGGDGRDRGEPGGGGGDCPGVARPTRRSPGPARDGRDGGLSGGARADDRTGDHRAC